MTERGDGGRALWVRHTATTTPAGSCPEVLELAAFLDGRLTGAERDALEGHLAGCERCLGPVVAETQEGVPAATPPASLVARARLAVSLAPRDAPAWLWSGLAAGVAAALVVTSWVGFQAGRSAAESERHVARAMAAELTFGLSAEVHREARPPAGFPGPEEERP